ncbi:MAG: 50S ribosomal protein L6 [Deltaproteobacteria bacterium]|jgi:large subunit ribosomal protein L6|nr:50S ribosomal protein L6 [Deltaproteobacteria bacterium]
MSRIGKKNIEIPKGVEVKVSASEVSVKGPKGQLSRSLNPLVAIKVEAGEVVCERKDDSREARSAHGLMRALTYNMVHGVSQGWERKLEINGVGYRAETKGNILVLNLGFSHSIEYPLPDGISAKVEKNLLTLSGIDKEALGAAAANVRSFRPPEPYKGKGVKYIEEHITRKVGKAAG